jgi:hypothetical protein
MAFKKAERAQLYLRCALFGPSGSGKTMSALRIAKGIADKMGVPFAVIDTEARSASKYADRIPFVVDDLTKKTVDDYIASMNECVKLGYKVLVIDSLSHAWRELTEEVDRIAEKSTSKNTFSPWAKVNPKQKRFIDAILNFPGHIIATMRSNTEWVIGQKENGKSAPEKVGLKPEQGKGIEFEFDLLLEMDQKHQATVTKDRTGKFQDEVIDRPGEEFGVTLHDWLSRGNAVLPPVSLPQANTAPEPAETGKTETKSEKPKAAPPATSVTSKSTGYKEAGETIIREIGELLNTASPSGQPYFSEEEKTEARQLVTNVKMDAAGVKQLKDFGTFLSNEIDKRKSQKPGTEKAA